MSRSVAPLPVLCPRDFPDRAVGYLGDVGDGTWALVTDNWMCRVAIARPVGSTATEWHGHFSSHTWVPVLPPSGRPSRTLDEWNVEWSWTQGPRWRRLNRDNKYVVITVDLARKVLLGPSGPAPQSESKRYDKWEHYRDVAYVDDLTEWHTGPNWYRKWTRP